MKQKMKFCNISSNNNRILKITYLKMKKEWVDEPEVPKHAGRNLGQYKGLQWVDEESEVYIHLVSLFQHVHISVNIHSIFLIHINN